MNFLLITILTGGLSMTAFGLAKIIRIFRLRRSAVTTEGTIIEFEKRRSNRRFVYVPIVVFFTPECERIEFRGECGTRKLTQQIGESIAVFYNPREPRWCCINDSKELWLPGGELIGGGLLISFISAYFLRLIG